MKNELPKSYYIGQEFIEDPIKIDVIISWYFYSPAILSEFTIAREGWKIETKQKGGAFSIKLRRKISRRLFSMIKNKSKGENFIIGYINPVLPIINQKINEQKYLNGHLLARTFGTLDIRDVKITNIKNNKEIQVPWPQTIADFPPSKKLATKSDQIFIRDLIDACTFYFNYNLDDCIRRVITSLENFFHLYKIKGSFRGKLDKCLKEKYYLERWSPYLKIFYNNINFVYDIRNDILHDSFRINFEHRWFCKKAIGTLSYIYQSNLLESSIWEYVFSLMLQFLLLDDFCGGFNLDEMAKVSDKFDAGKDKAIRKPEDLDKFMFKGLEISEKEKLQIKGMDKD